MKKILLSENHRRSISASLFVVEATLNEIESTLKHPAGGCLSKMEVDISKPQIVKAQKKIAETRRLVEELSDKYGLSVQYSSMSRFIISRKVKIWEILRDTSAKKLNGYGAFPSEYAREFDKDINKLLALVDRI